MSQLFNPSQKSTAKSWIEQAALHRGIFFTGLILTALVAFEAFNYSTTQYSLLDLLGKMEFAGVKWATILAIAFCGIDFAGIARLFTNDQGSKEPSEVWYLFGAWFLAATMNAILTWWGVSIAIQDNISKSSPVIDPNLLLIAVPIFVAVMVWLIRILIIGTLSYASDRLSYPVERPANRYTNPVSPIARGLAPERRSIPVSQPASYNRPAMQAASRNVPDAARLPETEDEADRREIRQGVIAARPEPVYQNLASSHRPPSTPTRQF